MRIWVDRARLAAYNLTVQDVEDALRAQNVEIPSGRIESIDREFNVLSRTGLETPASSSRAIVVKLADGYQVKMRDVARVELGAETSGAPAASWARSAIIGRHHQAGDGQPARRVERRARSILPAMRESLPDGMTASIGYDSAVFIDRSI